jgi:hypothetical protein
MRAMRGGVAALVVLLVVLGGYGAYWLIVAHRIEQGIARWAQSEQARKLDTSWQSLAIGGFPARFRIKLRNAVLRDRSLSPAPELHVPVLAADARPWDLGVWRLSAPTGLVADLRPGVDRPPVRLAAARAEGVVALAGRGGTLWLRLDQAKAEAGEELSFAVAAILHRVAVPDMVRALGDNIDELAFGATLKGALPGGNLVQALAAWRAAGGTIELDNLALKWNGLDVTATGTIALDRELQPIGGFSGAVEGYDQLLRAFVESGRMRPSDAGLAQLALTMLAKAGPDGRPQIATSLTIENGQVFLGPARLGPLPRFAWK